MASRRLLGYLLFQLNCSLLNIGVLYLVAGMKMKSCSILQWPSCRDVGLSVPRDHAPFDSWFLLLTQFKV